MYDSVNMHTYVYSGKGEANQRLYTYRICIDMLYCASTVFPTVFARTMLPMWVMELDVMLAAPTTMTKNLFPGCPLVWPCGSVPLEWCVSLWWY